MEQITTRIDIGEEKINLLIYDMGRSLNINEKSIIFFGEVKRSDIWSMFDTDEIRIGKTITPESDIIEEENSYKIIYYLDRTKSPEDIKETIVPNEYNPYDYIIGVVKTEYHEKFIGGVEYDD